MKRKILIIVANYYSKIANGLLAGAIDSFNKEILKKIKVKTIKVPGVFEIPVVLSKNIKKYDAFVALGCVIKGETPHFDYISKTTIQAIMRMSIKHKKPIGNGILTCLDLSQALARSNYPMNAKNKKKNKGREAARAAISVLGILKNE